MGRWVGVGGGEGGGKTLQVKTRGHRLPSDGPDHSTNIELYMNTSNVICVPVSKVYVLG